MSEITKQEDVANEKAPTLWERLTSIEPALVRGVIAFVVLAAGAIGFDVTSGGDMVSVVVLAGLSLIPLIQAWWTRGSVTPSARVVAVASPDGQTLAGPASPLPTGEIVVTEPAMAWDLGKVDNTELRPY